MSRRIQTALEVGLSAAGPVVGVANLFMILKLLPTQELASWISACAWLTVLSVAVAPLNIALFDVKIASDERGELISSVVRCAMRYVVVVSLLLGAIAIATKIRAVAWAVFLVAYICRLGVECLGIRMQSAGRYVAEKMVRLACPCGSLVVLSICRPTTFSTAAVCVAGAYSFVALFGAWHCHCAVSWSGLRRFAEMVWEYGHGVFLTATSLAIYSFPVLIFSLHATTAERVKFGLGVQLITSATLFFGFVSARNGIELAHMILKQHHVLWSRVVPPLVWALAVAGGAAAALILYGLWKNLPMGVGLALAALVAAAIELCQSFATVLRMRIGETRFVKNAIASGVVCSGAAMWFETAAAVFVAVAGAQLIFYLLPHCIRLRTLLRPAPGLVHA